MHVKLHSRYCATCYNYSFLSYKWKMGSRNYIFTSFGSFPSHWTSSVTDHNLLPLLYMISSMSLWNPRPTYHFPFGLHSMTCFAWNITLISPLSLWLICLHFLLCICWAKVCWLVPCCLLFLAGHLILSIQQWRKFAVVDWRCFWWCVSQVPWSYRKNDLIFMFKIQILLLVLSAVNRQS